MSSERSDKHGFGQLLELSAFGFMEEYGPDATKLKLESLMRILINADDKKTQPKQVAEAEPVVKPDERSNQMAAKASVKRKSPARKRAQARSPKKTTAAKALNVFSDGNGFESRGNSSALESDTVGNVIMKARLRQRKKS